MAPAQLPTRQLGKNGPQVTAIGYGAMGLSIAYGEVGSEEERLKFLDQLYESGCHFWDTADVYADNEDLIGKWFSKTGKRDEIFLATKFAMSAGADGSLAVRNDPAYIREAVQKSLTRLGVDSIDLYYCHRFDGKVPAETVIETMAEFVKQGKVKHLGISECSAETLRRCHKIHPISAVQVEYSPIAVDIESSQIGLLKTCRELGVATVAYSPLCRGMLTGAYKSPDAFGKGDFRSMMPRFSSENFHNNLKLVDNLKDIATKKGCTPGQLTLAWLLAQGDDIIPIPGTKKIKYLEENLGALKIKISDAEDKEIRQAIEATEVKGQRYPKAMVNHLYADTPPLKL